MISIVLVAGTDHAVDESIIGRDAGRPPTVKFPCKARVLRSFNTFANIPIGRSPAQMSRSFSLANKGNLHLYHHRRFIRRFYARELAASA